MLHCLLSYMIYRIIHTQSTITAMQYQKSTSTIMHINSQSKSIQHKKLHSPCFVNYFPSTWHSNSFHEWFSLNMYSHISNVTSCTHTISFMCGFLRLILPYIYKTLDCPRLGKIQLSRLATHRTFILFVHTHIHGLVNIF